MQMSRVETGSATLIVIDDENSAAASEKGNVSL
jgi:hypothetical protein